ncbi:hypothetical protein SAMN03159382_02385 [Pseudomonas sp. NFACC23-1]|nr:hypothetical protein SAMN03159386_02045 [Pseudomonas sp. NFACC17-2]SEJ41280.1 hypothetical protein SAMN03159382_02385 [Pseudomonas sp. NFACC23-1]SFW66457.1 hypothetical protein SAMN05660640_02593 [Pseudomonas sp. NFACC16-2]
MEFDFSVLYDTDEKEFNGLDLYYGSKSLQGISEAISIATHGIVNKSYISRSTAKKGIKIDFKTSFTGSFKQRFKVAFTNEKTVANLHNLTTKSYIELLQYTLGQVIGDNREINRRTAIKTFEKMYFSEDITHRLTTSISDVHLPVKHQGLKATLYAAQTPIATFNQNTLSYLEEEITNPVIEKLIVGISRFNARTGTGRLVQDIDGDSFSFVPHHMFSKRQKSILVRSLYGITQGNFTALHAEVSRVTLNNGATKYFILHKAELIE